MTDWYVKDAATGAGDGTSAADAYTFGDVAWASLSAGDTIYAIGAITATINPSSSQGTAASPITIRGDAAGETAGNVTAATTAAISVNGDTNYTLSNITLNDGTTAGIFVGGASGGVVFDNCVMTQSAAGERTFWQLGGTLTGKCELRHNDITQDYGGGASGNTQGVYLSGGLGGFTFKTTHNYIHGSVGTNTNSTHVGLHIDAGDGGVFEGDRIEDWFTGIRLTAADSHIIRPKSVDGCSTGSNGNGVLLETTSTSNKILGGVYTLNYDNIQDATSVGSNQFIANVHITPVVNGVSYACTGAGQGVIAQQSGTCTPVGTAGHGIVVQNGSSSTRAQIVNCIFHTTKLAANIQGISIDTDNAGAIIDTVDIDYNCWWVTNSAHIGALDGTNYDTMSAWQGALDATPGPAAGTITGKDANSISADPQFISATDLRLDGDSPCISAGTHWWTGEAPHGDDGLRFMNTPSMGAYEVRRQSGYARRAGALVANTLPAGTDLARARAA